MKKLSCGYSKLIFLGIVSGSLLMSVAAGRIIAQETPKFASEEDAVRQAHSIRADNLIQHAKIISGEKYRGREAGRKGSRLSAKYIINQFRQVGLRPGGSAGTYLQTFKIEVGYRISGEFRMSIAGKSLGDFIRRRDYSIVHLIDKQASINAGLVFAGYGISRADLKFDEYKKVDVKGKAVLVFAGVPWDKKSSEWDAVSGARPSPYHSLTYKAQNAANHGAICLIIADDPLGWKSNVKTIPQLRNPDYNSPVDSPIPIVHISGDKVDQIIGLSEDEIHAMTLDIVKDREPESHLLRGRQLHFTASVKGKAWVGRNIIGILPGRHPSFRNEAIVIGAHYDHLGEESDGVYFGANDNAAGVAAVIEIARTFGRMSGIRRTIMFVAFDAEEIGKLGSSYFIDHSPIIHRFRPIEWCS